jgi:hypothetical protein
MREVDPNPSHEMDNPDLVAIARQRRLLAPHRIFSFHRKNRVGQWPICSRLRRKNLANGPNEGVSMLTPNCSLPGQAQPIHHNPSYEKEAHDEKNGKKIRKK